MTFEVFDGRHNPITQELIGIVYALLGLENFCSVFSYLFFYWEIAYRVASVHFSIFLKQFYLVICFAEFKLELDELELDELDLDVLELDE